jgi:hypothetical protein
MKKTTTLLRTLLAAGSLLLALAAPAFAATPLKAPQSVKGGLRVLHQVVGHTGRLIEAKDYATVPKEHHEIVEGAAMLREGLFQEPAAFKAQVEPRLEKALAASAALAAPAAAKDDVKLAAAHAAFAAAVKDVLALFPAELHPKPRAPKKA